jgi:hypothetical protein
MYEERIRIGTIVQGGQDAPAYIREIIPHGFESFSVNFWKTVGDTDLERLAGEVNETLAGSDIRISCLGIFGNPLEMDADAREARESWEKLIDAAHLFDCDLVAGFAGRLVDRPLDESVPRSIGTWSASTVSRAPGPTRTTGRRGSATATGQTLFLSCALVASREVSISRVGMTRSTGTNSR